jgi:hypothetical protein
MNRRVFVFGAIASIPLLRRPALGFKPACGTSWYQVRAQLDPRTLPTGVTVESSDFPVPTESLNMLVLHNRSAKPIIVGIDRIVEAFRTPEFKRTGLPRGTEGRSVFKLVSDETYRYFENGPPVAGGSQHKGWVSLAELFRGPELYPGSSKGVRIFPDLLIVPSQSGPNRPRVAPSAQPFVMKAYYEGAIIELEGTLTFRLNPKYNPANPGRACGAPGASPARPDDLDSY